VERDKPKKSESVEQTLPQLPWKFKKNLISGFHGNAILNLINMPKASTHHGEYSYDDQGISEKYITRQVRVM
jgi:hypothetical protein